MRLGDLLNQNDTATVEIDSETHLPVMWAMYDAYLEGLLKEKGPEDALYIKTAEFYNKIVDDHLEQGKPDVLSLGLTLQEQLDSCFVMSTFLYKTKQVIDMALNDERYELVSMLTNVVECAEKMLEVFKMRNGTEINVRLIEQ